MKSTSHVNLERSSPMGQVVRLLHHMGQLAAGWREDRPWRRSVLSILDQGMVSVASFATVILLGRFTSEAELGLYYLPLTILLVYVNVQGELITSPYSVYRQRLEGAELALYTGSSLIHQAIATAIGTILFAVLSLLCRLGWMNPQLELPFRMLILAGPCWLVRSYIRYTSFANLRFGAALLVDLVASGLQMSLLVALALSGRLTAVTTYGAIGVGCLAACQVWYQYWRCPMTVNLSRAWSDWKRNWTFARWALASQLVCCTTPYILPWLLVQSHGEAAAGVLAACTNLCGLAMLFVLGVTNVLTPQAARSFASGGVSALVAVLKKTTWAFLAAVGLFCLGILLAGDWVMELIYGSRFAGHQLVLTLLAFSVLATSISIVAGNGLWAVDRPRANMIADVCTLAVTLVVAALLIGRYGVVGAAAATCIGNAAGGLTRGWVLRQVLREFSSAEPRA